MLHSLREDLRRSNTWISICRLHLLPSNLEANITTVRCHLAVQRPALLCCVQRPVCQVQLHRCPSGMDESHDRGFRLHDNRSLANVTAATSPFERQYIPSSTATPVPTASAGGCILPQQQQQPCRIPIISQLRSPLAAAIDWLPRLQVLAARASQCLSVPPTAAKCRGDASRIARAYSIGAGVYHSTIYRGKKSPVVDPVPEANEAQKKKRFLSRLF